MIERRKFLTGLISLVAAPAIVRAGSLMPVKAMPQGWIIRTILPPATWRELNVYGRSPAMFALADLDFIESCHREILRTTGLLSVNWRTEGVPSQKQEQYE